MTAAAAALALALLAPAAGAAPLTISVDPSSAGPAVPQDFLGLSYEVKALPQIASYAHTGNMVTLLRDLGHGSLRFGGVTADSQTAWSQPGHARPQWANSAVAGGDIASLAQLVRAAGWRTLLTLNLGHYDPQAAADETAIAKADLGDALAGVEIGNEPNAYAVHGLRPEPWTFAQYQTDIDAYRQAIDAAAPGVPLAGPGASSGHTDWMYNEAGSEHPALLTGHFYSLGCHSRFHSDVQTLFSTEIRQRLADTINHFGLVSQYTGIPLRIAETNNVSCGGKAGVSESFASALWATDLMQKAIDAGVAGVNFHGSLSNCHGYAPLCAPTDADAAAGRLQAQPEWYALLLARRLLGDRPLRSYVRDRRAKVDVSALAAPGGGMHILIVDERPHHDQALPVQLHVPARYASGTILRLTARLPTSTAGVRLGGRRVTSDGSWQPPARLPLTSGKPGALTLTVPAGSAALVTLR